MKKIASYLLPSLGSLVFVLVLFGALSLGPRMMNMDGDLGRHLTIGQSILDLGRIPLRDEFSHTMSGDALTPHEWLAQVIFAIFYRWLGLNGPVWVTSACIAAALYIVFRKSLQRSKSVLAAMLIVILAMAASSLHWLTRPHIFTFLLLSIWMVGIERLREGKYAGWFGFPLLMLLWANLHGAFIAGFMVWGLYGLGYVWDRWVGGIKDGGFAPGFGRYFCLVGGGSLLATFLNPVGPRLWGTSVGFLGNAYLVGHTAEYLSPDFHQPSFWPFLLLIVMGFALFGLAPKRPKTVDVIVFTAWAGMGLYSARNIPLFALLAAPVLAVTGKDLLDKLSERHELFDWFSRLDQRLTTLEVSLRGLVWPAAALVIALGIFLAGGRLDSLQTGNCFDPAVFPVDAVTWLQKNPQPGEMFNYFPWGGYLLFREWPQWRVFIDGQTDFYGEDLTREYDQVLTAGDGWQKVLDKYQVRWILLPPTVDLVKQVEKDPDWKLVYQDHTAVVIVKK